MAFGLTGNSEPGASEKRPPPVSEGITSSPAEKSKLQSAFPTEILQAILMELRTIGDAKAAIRTCRTMHDAFKGYEKTITCAVLCRELGPTLPGTFGALAIFASPRKGPADEPFSTSFKISARYWAPMLRAHGELARGLLSLGMAARMLAMHRKFVDAVDHEPSGECPACRDSGLAEELWDPLGETTVGNCVEHLLQANAVHFRLTCRMVMDCYGMPREPRNGGFD